MGRALRPVGRPGHFGHAVVIGGDRLGKAGAFGQRVRDGKLILAHENGYRTRREAGQEAVGAGLVRAEMCDSLTRQVGEAFHEAIVPAFISGNLRRHRVDYRLQICRAAGVAGCDGPDHRCHRGQH